MNFLERAKWMLDEYDKGRSCDPFTVLSVMAPQPDESRWVHDSFEPARLGVYTKSKWETLKEENDRTQHKRMTILT